ncbi:MAG: ABC transporter permease [Clostridiales bacterium]|nr:ABC transporter permease [Candidatus Coliplasma caballi]
MLNSLLNAFPGSVAQGLIWGLMAIGVFITYKILDIADLTVDGSICTGGAVCAVMMINGCNVWISMFVAFLAGMLAGLATGVFHVFMGIPPILAGILTQLSLYSVNLKIMSGANVSLSVRNYDLLVSLQYLKGVPFYCNTLLVVALILAAVIGVLYWFFGTEIGCGIRATGCNAAMSKAQGINTDRNKIIALMMSNGIVAFSGALLTQYQGFADVNMGRGAVVIGLAAIIIGEALFGKLLKNNFALKLLQVGLGGIVYYIVYQAVIMLGTEPDMMKMYSALVVAIFLAIPYLKERYFKKNVASKGESHA